MTDEEEIQYYQNVLSEAMQLLCGALGVCVDHYDRDQSDFECYLDCFRDASEEIAELKQQRDELLALLDRYGQHDATCLLRIDPQVGNCDCGFDEAIAKAGDV